MSNSSKKTPWHLRFAPGAILRPIGRLAFKAVSLASAILQPIRQRLNQWNWRKKTALVTALAITAARNFVYQYKANAGWPLVIAASVGTDFLVNVVASYASSRAINSKIKKTANANPDGNPLYSNREYHVRDYDVDASGTQTESYRINADADALYHKAYETSGTDTRYSPSTLEQGEVLYLVDRNANLNGFEVTYEVLEKQSDGSYAPLYTWNSKNPDERYLETYTDYYGGYVQPLTDAEIQEDLDRRRKNWTRSSSKYKRPPSVRALKKGRVVGRTTKTFVCDKEVRLWSRFSFNRVPGDTNAGPNELQQPGQRPNYVTSFKYRAREAGYQGYIVTKVPANAENEEFTEYPEPESYRPHNYMEHELESIKWDNFKITQKPNWTGEATRFFKHKKIRNWCTFCNRKHTFSERWFQRGWLCRSTHWRTRHEIPVYQNESVTKP